MGYEVEKKPGERPYRLDGPGLTSTNSWIGAIIVILLGLFLVAMFVADIFF